MTPADRWRTSENLRDAWRAFTAQGGPLGPTFRDNHEPGKHFMTGINHTQSSRQHNDSDRIPEPEFQRIPGT